MTSEILQRRAMLGDLEAKLPALSGKARRIVQARIDNLRQLLDAMERENV